MAGNDSCEGEAAGWSGTIRFGPSVITYRCEPIEGYILDAADVARLRSDILSDVRDLLREGHLHGTVTAFMCVGLVPGGQDDDDRPVTCTWSIAQATV